MTEPLLTIDEATRAFRTSPKTIRRRLAAGEIDGAYKRPGDRGPEWVMPAGSLVAAGFLRRPGADIPTLPEDPIELAAYWERRATDAEAAGGPPPAPEVDRRGHRWRVPVLCVAALVLVALAFMAGQRTAPDEDGARPDPDPVRTLLLSRTQVGERIGIVGAVPDGIVPDGRRVERLDADALPDEMPRYVVSGLQDGWAPPATDDLRSSAAALLSRPGNGGVQVFDTGAPALGTSDAASARSESAPEDGITDPAAPEDGAAGSPASAHSSAPAPAGPVGPPIPSGHVASHTVEAGDSFWTVATELVSEGGGASTATITRYWTALVDANADRLVEPDNPDLLHVGQVLVLPPVV